MGHYITLQIARQLLVIHTSHSMFFEQSATLIKPVNRLKVQYIAWMIIFVNPVLALKSRSVYMWLIPLLVGCSHPFGAALRTLLRLFNIFQVYGSLKQIQKYTISNLKLYIIFVHSWFVTHLLRIWTKKTQLKFPGHQLLFRKIWSDTKRLKTTTNVVNPCNVT